MTPAPGGRGRERARRRRRRVRRAVWPLLVSVALVGVLFTAVFPTRTFLAQRAATNAAEERLRVLGEENARLEERVERLHSDEELERIAREQYHLVKPGEEAYAVLPPPSKSGDGGAGAADGAPAADAVDDEPRSFLERAWDVLTSWL